MSAEHKRPLVAFVLVALVCSSIVGQSVRSALLGNGIGLGILVPIAPAHLLDTIHASGANGRYLDTPFLGTAISAVGDVPAPAAPEPQPRPRRAAGVAVRGLRLQRSSVVQVVATRPSATTAPRVHRARPRTSTSPASTSRAPATSVARLLCPRARPPCRPPATTCTRPGSTPARPGRRRCRRPASPGSASAPRARPPAPSRSTTPRRPRSGPTRQPPRSATSKRGAAPPRCDRRVRRPGPGAAHTYLHRAGGDGPSAVRRGTGAGPRGCSGCAGDQPGPDGPSHFRPTARPSTRPVRRRTRRLTSDCSEVRAYAKESPGDRATHPVRVRAEAAVRERRGGPGVPEAGPGGPREEDRAFAARIGAERDRAAAAYETATGVAKQELDRVRDRSPTPGLHRPPRRRPRSPGPRTLLTTKVQTAADVRAETIADAQALAEATVVVDPATLPVDPGPTGGDPPDGAG